jgi:membrane peptidoglycan carboxypeptidase
VFNADHVGKGKSVGRLVTMSALGGVLVAGLMLPAVGSIGLAVKTAATKFTALSPNLGQVPQRSEILNSEGHLITYIYDVDEPYYYGPGNVPTITAGGIDRAPVSYNQISPWMRNAAIAIEDSRYWLHGAIDFRGTLRAIVNDLEHQPIQGGSTIAQQYVKNLQILTAANPLAAESAVTDTLSRKLDQLRMAIAVEHEMSKQDILAGYLNDAYFAGPIVGVETAAEYFFGTTAAKLTLTQGATLAGMVENPTAYNPITEPAASLTRRNTVIARMQQVGMISQAVEQAAMKQPLGVHQTSLQNGCSSASAAPEGFFCDYVVQSILRDPALGQTPQDRARLLATGGLKIYTTLNQADQRAAENAVNYLVPDNSFYNPGHNADTEAVIQPGTGDIRAIAEDRPYGTGRGETTIDYAADTAYDGGSGIQSGSSSKLFTLITALEQGVPFGFTQTVQYSETVQPYFSCNGQQLPPYQLVNAGTGDHGTYSLYTGTTFSINTFFAQLEKKVGLCNVVHTAAALGVHRADGLSIWQGVGNPSSPNYQPPADQLPSFTLGSVNVSPMTMAAAYATVAARGIYCSPVALESITTDTGKSLPVPSAGCHRAIPAGIADAVSYILQGVLTDGTATGDGINRPAAGKTGTGNGPHYVDFGGYTPSLASYSSVFDPTDPIDNPMVGLQSCYRSPPYDGGGQDCPGEMFGADAPGQTWQMTFLHADLGPVTYFVPVPADSPLFSKGNGQSVQQNSNPSPPHTGPGGGGHGHCPAHLPICPFSK